jgi:SAM-dependent methyltransferase
MTPSRIPWFADETFWSTSFPFMFPQETFDRAREEVAMIVYLTGCEGGRVLDLACGPGRHAVPFAQRGFQVTAVDCTSLLLEKARGYAADRRVAIEWVEQDMRQFRRPEMFDLAVSLFTSFGFFDDAAENERVLANVHASLRSGGQFVIDVAGKEVIARRYQPVAVSELPEAGLMVQRRTIIDNWSRIANEWSFVRKGVVRSVEFCVWVYSGKELADMLTGVGFSHVALFGGLDGSPYGTDARRLVALARK